LGTPASGVVTNLTGTASININGTVGATTANTGAFTTVSSTTGANFATSSGSVGVGTASPSFKTEIQQAVAGNAPSLRLTPQLVLKGYNGNSSFHSGIGFSMNEHTNGYWGSGILEVDDSGSYGAALAFYTSTGAALASPSERMRISSAGNVLIGSSSISAIAGVPVSNGAQTTGGGNWVWAVKSTSASSNRGIVVNYSSASPNDTANEMLFCYDSSGTRFSVRSNGGIANYQSNNVDLSDERVKKDISSADSYLDKMCAIEVVKFKYKDQTHDDYNLGVIAQQVETVAPEFVDAEGFDPNRSDLLPLKAIYHSDLNYGTLKAVQELALELKSVRARLAALEAV
jgi:hypothetical protein